MSISQATDLTSDSNGARLASRLVNAGHNLAAICCVDDDEAAICDQVQSWLDDMSIDVILTVSDLVDVPDAQPPRVTLMSGDDERTEFTSVVRDHELGFVEIVNLRSAHQLAA